MNKTDDEGLLQSTDLELSDMKTNDETDDSTWL